MIWSGCPLFCPNRIAQYTERIRLSSLPTSPLEREQKTAEPAPQCQIETLLPVGHSHLVEAGHWKVGNTARDDPRQVGKFCTQVNRESVHRDPAPDPDADRADLGLAPAVAHPDADPPREPGRPAAPAAPRGAHPPPRGLDVA